MRAFAGLELGRDNIPDETTAVTIGHFSLPTVDDDDTGPFPNAEELVAVLAPKCFRQLPAT